MKKCLSAFLLFLMLSPLKVHAAEKLSAEDCIESIRMTKFSNLERKLFLQFSSITKMFCSPEQNLIELNLQKASTGESQFIGNNKKKTGCSLGTKMAV